MLSCIYRNRRNTLLSHSDPDNGLMYIFLVLKSMAMGIGVRTVNFDLHVCSRYHDRVQYVYPSNTSNLIAPALLKCSYF